jgi:cyanophycin synthetase
MKILSIGAIEGPNLFHHLPVLSMRLDLQDAAGFRSDHDERFVDALLALLPGLSRHGCSLRRPGGFVERLRRGTYLGHIVEHVALELAEPAGIDVSYGKTVSTGTPGVMQIVVRYRCEQGMRFLLEQAVAIVDALRRHQAPPAIESVVARAQRIVARSALGPSARCIVEAASARGIPWRRVGEGSLVRLGWGRQIRWVKTAVSDATGLIAAENAKDKELTKTLLREAGIRVPRGSVVRSADEAAAALRRLPHPLAVKPLSGNHGRGCTLGVVDEAGVRAAYAHAALVDRSVLVEEQVTGSDHRLLVVGGRLVAASLREPARVVGDGVLSIAGLVARENADPRRGDGHAKPLTRISVDEAVRALLATRGLTIDSVPAAGETVLLRQTANLSTGGTATDVTDRVHPSVARAAVRAAAAVGLDICGIDYLSPDIGAEGGAVIEVNAGPGLRMHTHPSAGTSRDVGGAIVDMLYPAARRDAGHRPGRIPLVSITGTNGKTTVTRMVGHVLAGAGTVGMACTDGLFIGGQQIGSGDCAGPTSARTVLADPAVDYAVLETARGGIARRGLGFDWADVGVITNVRSDHIGQDGIHSLDDLVRVKSLVAERVRPGGVVVLNADDPSTDAILARPGVARVLKAADGRARALWLFALDPTAARLKRHLANGGRAFVLENGWLVERCGSDAHADPQRLLPVARLPAALGGIAQFNIANALAAAAACRALGIARDAIALALGRFLPTERNRGRANLYAVKGGYVLADYGHNPDAFDALGRMAAQLGDYQLTAVVDMPGDRADSVLRDGAQALARVFDRVILHKPKHARGRRPGEVAEIICAELSRIAPQIDCLMADDEADAMERALAELGPGRFALLCYESFDNLQRALARHDAQPATEIPVRESHAVVWA